LSFFSFQDAISGNDVKTGLDNSLSQAKSQITQAIKNKTAQMTAKPIASQPKKKRRSTVKRSAVALPVKKARKSYDLLADDND